MRIVHVTRPVDAGVAMVVTALAEHQAVSGHDVVVLCPPEGRTDGPLSRLVGRPGIEFTDWPATRSPGRSTVRETVRLRRLVRATGADVVVLHSAKAGLAGRLAVRGRIPTVFVPHAWSFDAVDGAVRAATLSWERFAQRWTDVTVCVSTDERDQGRAARVTGRVTVIGNGVDLDRFVPTSQQEARRQLGFADVPTVVCVGRITRQKGQDRLIAAWPAVRRACPTARLVLVGDGPERPAWEALGVDGVDFVGFTSDPRLHLCAADVVALSSRWEAGALVPLEAMASGRPVVAVDARGVRDVVGGTGTVVPGGDDAPSIAVLAEALASRLLDPAGTAALGRQARRRAVEQLSITSTLDHWDDLLVVEGVSR